ncbi:MAG TPA: PAS domain S-box protein [Pirellulales bacterium]|nr:PAS domain S-box protein [Pirellulales bacterium]
MRKLFDLIFGRRPADKPGEAAALRTALANQKYAEAGLHESEQHFAELVAGVRDYAVFLLDAEGRVMTWNAGAERIKGYRAEEIIGHHFSKFYPKEAVVSGWPAHELKVAAASGRYEEEGWRLRKDGSRFWASVVITALRDANGDPRGFLKITRDLTDRKQAEQKLRLSEERFRLMVEGVRDYAIFGLDPEGRVATWNAGAERMKGYKADEIVGEHFSKFYPQDALDRGWPAEELRRAMADGRIEDEGWRLRKDGSRFWANVVITALRDETGTLRGFAKVTRDLTERRAAEENARRLIEEEAARKAAEHAAREIELQREKLHVTLSSIGDAVIVTDADGAVTFLNPVAEELTGWKLDQASGQRLAQIFQIINEDSQQPVENPVVTVFREKRIVAIANHTALVCKDGREVPIEDSAAPIRGRHGTIDGAVLVFRDVTEKRRAMETRIHLAAIVESSDDAIIGNDLEGRITSWNPGAERLYGYTAAAIVGQLLSVLIPPDHPDDLPTIMETIKQGGHIDHFETVRVRNDGRRLDVSLTISPIRNSEGRIIGASKIARDITARKEEDRRKNEFLAMLAHELRNPLAPLRTGLEVMRLSAHDGEDAELARRMMERQLEHLVRLVDDLLDVSRISRGKLSLRLERLTLSSVVEHALELCDGLFKEHGQELAVTLPDEPLYVEADQTRLAQALCNLLNNAVKYSDRGSRIWLTVERDGHEAIIRIKDEGIGIEPDMLPKVFDLFIQVDRSLEKSKGGLGVGLTIVKRLVEMHGGTVEAFSEGHGRGSEFVVRLPIALTVVKEQGIAETQEPPHLPGQHRILVVDDNVDAASSLAMMLKIMGNQVRMAHDGVEAIEAAEDFRPDVILLDIGMPRMNGYDACRRIREQSWGKSPFIVALTGWGQEEDKRRSHEAGFNSHLVKPVELAALQRLLLASKSG